MLYVREIAENFLIVTDVYLEMEHVLVQRSKKIEMDEKSNFKQRFINVTKRANSSGRMI